MNKAISHLEHPPLGPRTGTQGGVGRRLGAVSGPGTILFLREVAVKCGGDRPAHQTRTQAGRGREGAVEPQVRGTPAQNRRLASDEKENRVALLAPFPGF